jgi:DNA transposition AAA+ family ATPase
VGKNNVVALKEQQPYRNKETEKVRQELLRLMEENGYNVFHFANLFEIGRSTLHMFLNGTYSATVELAKKLKPEIEAVRERMKEKDEKPIPGSDLFRTVALQKCHHVLDFCRNGSELGVVVGPAGVGKTAAVGAYVEGQEDIILLEADPTWGKFGALKVLAEALGLDPDRHSRIVLNNVVEALILKPCFIVVDEADLISHPGLEVLRTIFDRCGGRVGLALVGMPRLYQNMTKGRSGRANLSQLYSRVAIFGKLPMPTLKEVRAYVKSQYPKATDDAIKALAEEGNAFGMRRVVKLLKGAAEVAEMNECELDAEVVEVAATRTMIMA